MESIRLKEIVNLVKENSIVADIGTDHGYIPVELIKSNKSKKVIGTDISKPSLQKMIDYVAMEGLEDKIEGRVGNGLEVIKPYEVDTVIIAGMGGLLISEILDKDVDKTSSINNFILQPMIAADELRKYLLENSFKIEKNILLKENGRFYEIIYAKIGKDRVENEIEYEIPLEYIEEKHPLIREFIEEKIRYNKSIILKLEDNSGENVKSRIKFLESKIKEYQEVLKEIES